MRVSAALSIALLALLAGAGSASAGPDLLIGVHDDTIKWTEQPAPIFGAVRALGLGAMRVTLDWEPGKRHLSKANHNSLMRAVAAERQGIRIVLGVYGDAADAPQTRDAREDYCRFVRNTLRRYGEIGDVVIWNEANSDTFWLPREGAPAAYAALLARCWDLLHETFPSVNVLTTTASSHDPAAFIRGVGAAYRSSGRTLPLFDSAGHNPYPLFPDESPTARHDVYIGQGDYDRLVAVLDESFAGTAQPATPIWYLRERLPDDRREHPPLLVHRPRERRGHACARRAGGAARDRASARQLPAARGRVLQLPPRRRDGARGVAVRPALGQLEAQAGIRRLPHGDRRGPARRRRLQRRSARRLGTVPDNVGCQDNMRCQGQSLATAVVGPARPHGHAGSEHWKN